MIKKKKNRLIGGVFGLDLSSYKKESTLFHLENHLCMVNARSCIYLLLKVLKPKRIWVPSYICPSIIKAIRKANYKTSFYSVDDNLRINDKSLCEKIGEKDIFLIINYFGFSHETTILKEVRKRKAWIVEDCAQALFIPTNRRRSDFVLYSPRKFIGVPGGGILTFNGHKRIKKLKLNHSPLNWWVDALEVNWLRRRFDELDEKNSWFEKYKSVEKKAPIGMYVMSEYTKRIIDEGIDWKKIMQCRRSNYQHLLKYIGEYAIYPVLPKKVVPLGFPVRIKNRDKILTKLYRDKIFPPVHWSISSIIPKKFSLSHKLSKEIMMLPCDQRYDIQDMIRMAKAFVGSRPEKIR